MNPSSVAVLLQLLVTPAAASSSAEACLMRAAAGSAAPVLLRDMSSATVEEKGGKSLVTVDGALYTPGPIATEPQRTGSMIFAEVGNPKNASSSRHDRASASDTNACSSAILSHDASLAVRILDSQLMKWDQCQFDLEMKVGGDMALKVRYMKGTMQLCEGVIPLFGVSRGSQFRKVATCTTADGATSVEIRLHDEASR